MPITKRITGEAARADIRRKAKGRHPLLQSLASRHLSVWQIIAQDGNPRGGITAHQIKQATHLFHPQILKDLIDAFLVVRVGRNANNEYKYVADDKGRGMLIQTVTATVELFEDEDGKFFTKTTLAGSDNVAGKIVRKIGERRIHMRIPALEERKHEDISDFDQPDLGDTKATDRTILDQEATHPSARTCVIDS